MKNQNLLNYLDPALRSLNAAHLDAGQCLIQLLRDRSHLGHAAREADLIAMIYDLADRRDDSCGTAKATLCEILYFIEVNLAFLDVQSEVILCYDEQRTTGDGRQDAVGLRGNDLIVLCSPR